MRKRLKRTVAALVLVALTALSVILVISMSGDSVSAGMREGTIGFSDEGAEIQKESLSQPVLENSSAALYLSENGSVTFLDKNTGVTYSNTAGEAGKGVFSNDDNELESPVILHYLAEQKNQSVIYSLDQSVLKGQHRLYREGDSVCVEYIIGEKTDEEILPEIISVEKFENEIIPELSDDDAEYLNRRYRKYYVGSDDPEQQPDDSVVEKFPILKEEAYYISVSMDAVKMRQRTMEILKEAGYTEADMKEDYEKSGYSDNENPLTFGITLKYRLEGNQRVVTVPHDSIRFYSDNPLLSVELMKYFTCSVGDEGYFVIPSGSGALMRFGKGSVEASFSQKVYGDDAVVRQTTIPYEMSEESSSYMLPMYGMCTDGLSVMAIIEGGASQAELSVYRNSEGARAGFLFTVTQSDYAAIGNAEPVLYCGADSISEDIVIRYIFLPGNDTDYSSMASEYRSYLIENGLLAEKTDDTQPPMVIETAGLIYADDGLLGLIPASRAQVLTTFEQSFEIADYFNSRNIKNTVVCFSGWNKEGLFAQEPGTFGYSSKLGGLSGFSDVSERLSEAGIKSCLSLNMAYYYNDGLFNGYIKSRDSARYIDKSIASSYGYDVVSGWVKDSGGKTETVAPSKYREYAEKYAAGLPQGAGAYLGSFCGTLNSDYSDSRYTDRTAAENSVTASLEKLGEGGRYIAASKANQYSFAYVDLLYGMQTNSGSSRYLDEDVPFVQMVVHGSLNYAVSAANLGGDSEKTALEAIESGSGMSFLFTYDLPDNIFDTEFSYLFGSEFGKIREDALKYYSMVSEALGGLNDIPILKHEKNNGVSRTEYSNGTVIIVNYNENDTETDGITVKAGSFCRLD